MLKYELRRNPICIKHLKIADRFEYNGKLYVVFKPASVDQSALCTEIKISIRVVSVDDVKNEMDVEAEQWLGVAKLFHRDLNVTQLMPVYDQTN